MSEELGVRNEELKMREKVIKGLEVVLNDIVDGYITEPNMACNTINDALALLKEPTQPTVPELKDLQVLRDVKSGKILKSGCKDYVIYNGDWYRQNRWDWPEKAQEPVEPVKVNRYKETDENGDWFSPETYDCGNCGVELHGKANYCHLCGKAVKWE